jgi:hypothetical protein
MQQHGFDVFAGAQAVGGEIHALAGELACGHVADFHRVGHARAALDSEAREHGFVSLRVADDEAFVLRAQAATVDLICVSGAPIVRGRDRDFAARLLLFPLHGRPRDYSRLQGCPAKKQQGFSQRAALQPHDSSRKSGSTHSKQQPATSRLPWMKPWKRAGGIPRPPRLPLWRPLTVVGSHDTRNGRQ